MISDSKSQTRFFIVADDSTVDRKILARQVSQLGFPVMECKTGKMVLDILQSHAQDSIIAIFTDLMMPDIDGVELIKIVKTDEKIKNIPIIAVTSLDHKPEFIKNLTDQGLNGCILKPFTKESFIKVIKEVLPQLNIN